MKFIQVLQNRSLSHDDSKFGPEEFPVYASMIDEFAKHKFGTDGYIKAKEAISEATKHHFAFNRHHPEYHTNGIDGMDLLDIIEMLADWKAATLNHPDAPGDMVKSLDYAVKKYNISPQLATILLNTIERYLEDEL